MIAVDFTFVSKKSSLIENGFTGSLEIFLADLLDGIADIGQADNFVIITTYEAKDYIAKRFPDYKVIHIGGFFGKAIYKVFGRTGIWRLRKYGFLDYTVRANSISHVWFPFMVPETVNCSNSDYLGTCHDLFCRLSNDDKSVYKMLSRAIKTVTISGYVKNEIMDLFNIPEDNLCVIPNPLSIMDTICNMKEIPELKGKRFIFCCNSYIERKNTIVLLKAYERIKDKTDKDLVLCGGYRNDEYYDLCMKYIKDHDLDKRVHVYFAIDEESRNWLFSVCSLMY